MGRSKWRGSRFLVIAGFLFVAFVTIHPVMAMVGLAALSSDPDELVQVKVYRLVTDPRSEQPVVLLSDPLEERALPIWIGFFEANAIASEMNGIEHPRPLTHDLLEKIIREARLSIVRVVVTHRKDNTYHAEILMQMRESQVKIDARPSDSIALALKLKAPLFVSKNLFNEVAVPIGEENGKEEAYGLSLQDLTPSLAKAFSYDSTRGVLVSDVHKGSRAETDGVGRGDIIVEVGGRVIEDVNAMRAFLERPEASVNVKVFRKGAFLNLTLHPASRD